MTKLFNTFTLLSLLLLSTSIQAQEAAPAKYEDPRWSMLKCTSVRNGTLWASFGHLMTSENDSVTYFPVEIVLFESASAPATRLLFYSDFKKALKEVQVRVANKKFSMEFEAPNQHQKKQKHKITLLQYSDLPHSYIGNWALVEEGKDDVMDEVHCQIF